MRYVSKLFQPILTIPKNAKIKNTDITCKSQKLLLECGLVRPTSSGLFTLLPLARRALDKLEALVINYIESAGAQRVSLPALTASQLWEKTGRLDDVGPELMGVKDRHDKKYLLAPTHEEAIADLLADVGPLSYKQLPLLLYQMNNKYRDELRPKHGLLRAREFSMMDAYGAHAGAECAQRAYGRLTDAYARLFHRLQLPVHRVEAPSGDMGGSLSHEWQLRADAGEDAIDICPSCSHARLTAESECDSCGRDMERVNSIEVGHTFVLGTRYSDPLKALYVPASGWPLPLIMSCYGIGLTRLLAASLETLSTEKSLRWPEPIAPYRIIVIGPKEGSREWSGGWEAVGRVTERLSQTALRHDVLIDDRHNLTVGKRLLAAERMGYPTIVVCGKSTLDQVPKYEVFTDQPEPRLMTLEELLATLSEKRDEDVLVNKV